MEIDAVCLWKVDNYWLKGFKGGIKKERSEWILIFDLFNQKIHLKCT